MNRNKNTRHSFFHGETRFSIMWDSRVQGWAVGNGETFAGVFRDYEDAWDAMMALK